MSKSFDQLRADNAELLRRMNDSASRIDVISTNLAALETRLNSILTPAPALPASTGRRHAPRPPAKGNQKTLKAASRR